MILFPIELERLGVGDDVFPMVYGVGLSVTYLAATVAAAVAGRLSGKRSPIWLMACRLDGQPGAAGADGVRDDLVAVHRPAGAAGAGRRCRPDAGVRGGRRGCSARAARPDGQPGVERRHPRLGREPADGGRPDPGQPDPAAGAGRRAVRGGRPDAGGGRARPARSDRRVRPAPSGAACRRARVWRRSVRAWPARASCSIACTAPASACCRRAARLARFTGAEVADALAGRLHGPRADSVLEMAAQTVPLAAGRSPSARSARSGGTPTASRRSSTRFGAAPTPEEIGRRMSPLGGEWPVRRTVEIASDLIARELNR